MNKIAEVNDHFEKSLEYKTSFEDLSTSGVGQRRLNIYLAINNIQ